MEQSLSNTTFFPRLATVFERRRSPREVVPNAPDPTWAEVLDDRYAAQRDKRFTGEAITGWVEFTS